MPDQNRHFSADKIARLARIALTPEQVEATQAQLDEILAFCEQLNEVDLDGVEPFFGATDEHRPVRSDNVRPSLNREQALANAPNHDNEFYRVPPVFGS